MGLWNSVKKQLRSVIEWEDPSGVNLFYKWSENGDEIKDASKLLVGPGQGVILVYEGKIVATTTEEGLLELETDNQPFVTTLKKYMQAFESEHKVGIYFFRTTQLIDLKWGTPSPIKYLDPQYKIPIQLSAYGNFSMRLEEPQNFFVNVIGKRGSVTLEEVRQMILSRLVQPMTDFFAESGFSYIDIDAQRDEISEGVKTKLVSDFSELGFSILDFRISGTKFDAKTMERIGRIADMTAEAQAAAAAGLNYADLQKLEALKTAAGNEGGLSGMGVGMGAGLGLGQMMGMGMGSQMNQQQANNQQQAADPNDPMAKLQKLKGLLDAGLINQDEYDAKKKEILASF